MVRFITVKIYFLITVLFSMVYGVDVSVVAAQDSNENKSLCQITGITVDLLGRPISGASITFLADSTTVSRSETRSDGKFALADLACGTGEMVVESVGFKKYRRPIYLDPHQNLFVVVGLDVGLLGPGPDLRIRGRVTDSGPKPVSSAAVTANSVYNENIIVATETTRSGHFELKVLSFGQYFVSIKVPGHKLEGRVLLLDKEGIYRSDLRLGRKIFSSRRSMHADPETAQLVSVSFLGTQPTQFGTRIAANVFALEPATLDLGLVIENSLGRRAAESSKRCLGRID